MATAANGYYSYDYSRDVSSSNYNGRSERYDKFGHNPENSNRVDHDKPPFSRLFVVCGKQHTASDLRLKFEEYGTVEDVWVVKDRNTKENRGIAYIKYSKMSEACLAIENLDGQRVNEDDEGVLKVLVAQSKSSKSSEDFKDETALTRLFVVLPKGTEESDLRESFQEYGDIDYVQVVKDRKTGEKKGFGYIKYNRSYDAAKALESCDRSYKAVMAEPKSSKVKRDSISAGLGSRQGSITGNMDWNVGSRGVDIPTGPGFQDGIRSAAIGNRLQVQCALHVTADQLCRLFDLIPGMELCDLKRNFSTGESKGIAVVVYNSVGSAIYAKEKLNGFEYPPGSKIGVRYLPEDGDGAQFTDHTPNTMGTPAVGGGSSYCSVPLPPAKPLANPDSSECAERLFVVCQPSPPPPNVLVDIFSRFGDLLDVFMLRDKNFGYAKYASTEAAEQAMQALHGAEVFGKKLKVLTAEPPKTAESARKRPRT